MARKPIALLANPHSLGWHTYEHLNAVRRMITETRRLQPKMSIDELIDVISSEALLWPLQIGCLQTMTVAVRKSNWRSKEAGIFAAHLTWAQVEYVGSPLLWKVKPPSFSWERFGHIRTSLKIKLLLDTLDVTETVEILEDELSHARRAIRELDEQVAEFNEANRPKWPDFVRMNVLINDLGLNRI
ncbi:MAG: hypothetical protein ACTHJR_11090 [Sphingomonas sp.]|uniref:hypothetical protein n=1 Tax=Sphingomonas sp. TaxID=28214 RepID=UPI003F7F3343